MASESETVSFDPVACGVVVREMARVGLNSDIWEPFGLDQGFHEDKFPMVVDGVTYPPTFNWVTTITALRRRDKEFFYVRLTIPKADVADDKINVPNLISRVDNAIHTLNSFADCACRVGYECHVHVLMYKEIAPT